ncbi:MAG: hypothetical protein R3A10_23825 [Caldilineaceae bacterium]
MTHTLLDDARDHARAILHHCVTPHGFSRLRTGRGLPTQVWAHPAVATFLGACVTGDAELIDCGCASLRP